MSLVWVVILVFLVLALCGNPHVGGRVYEDWSFGYWPSGLSLLIVCLLVYFLLFRGPRL
jgi:hypothetical protein